MCWRATTRSQDPEGRTKTPIEEFAGERQRGVFPHVGKLLLIPIAGKIEGGVFFIEELLVRMCGVRSDAGLMLVWQMCSVC